MFCLMDCKSHEGFTIDTDLGDWCNPNHDFSSNTDASSLFHEVGRWKPRTGDFVGMAAHAAVMLEVLQDRHKT